jgi:hypothetical protein
MQSRFVFEEAHIPGADFLYLQGEFSDGSMGEWARDAALPVDTG